MKININKLALLFFCSGLTSAAVADSFQSSETVYCKKSKTGNMVFEQCRDRTSGLTWSRTIIEAGNSQYLRGTDRNGNEWTAVREFKGKNYKTTYSDKHGNPLRVEECKEDVCSEIVMN